jgi:hypothetical protein
MAFQLLYDDDSLLKQKPLLRYVGKLKCLRVVPLLHRSFDGNRHFA